MGSRIFFSTTQLGSINSFSGEARVFYPSAPVNNSVQEDTRFSRNINSQPSVEHARDLQLQSLALRALLNLHPDISAEKEKILSVLQHLALSLRINKSQAFEECLDRVLSQYHLSSSAHNFFQSYSAVQIFQFLRASRQGLTREVVQLLVQNAKAILPEASAFRRVSVLGVLLSQMLCGSASQNNLFQQELLSVGRDFYLAVRNSFAGLKKSFCFARSHGLSEALYFTTAQERQEEERLQAAEMLIRVARTISPQLVEKEMNGDLGRKQGLREIEASLRRASVLFADTMSERVGMLANYAASVSSSYIHLLLSRTRFSGYALALSGIVGACNGFMQSSIQLSHQIGLMSAEQLHENQNRLLWQGLKGMLIGAGSGLAQQLVERLMVIFPFGQFFGNSILSVVVFCVGDVGAEIFCTHVLTQAAIAAGLEEEQVLEARGFYSFASNAIDEMAGGTSHSLNVVNLMNFGMLALPLHSSSVSRHESGASLFVSAFYFVKNKLENLYASTSQFVSDLFASQVFLFTGMGGVAPAYLRVARKKKDAQEEAERASTETSASNSFDSETLRREHITYSFEHPERNTPQAIESVLDEIAREQFYDEAEAMSLNQILATLYKFENSSFTISGTELMHQYCVARWKENNPDSPLSRESIERKPGFCIQKSFEYFLDYVLGYKTHTLIALGKLEIAYQSKKFSENSVACLETLLKAVVEKQFENLSGNVCVIRIRKTIYQIEGIEKPIGGWSLLNRYLVARWKEQHPDSTLDSDQIARQRGFGMPESLDYFLNKFYGYERSKKAKQVIELDLFNSHYETRKSPPNSLDCLEAVLRSVIHVQFHDKIDTVRATTITKSSYRLPDINEAFEGQALMNRYVVARWKHDNPLLNLDYNTIRQKSGYSNVESLNYFIEKYYSKKKRKTKK